MKKSRRNHSRSKPEVSRTCKGSIRTRDQIDTGVNVFMKIDRRSVNPVEDQDEAITEATSFRTDISKYSRVIERDCSLAKENVRFVNVQ